MGVDRTNRRLPVQLDCDMNRKDGRRSERHGSSLAYDDRQENRIPKKATALSRRATTKKNVVAPASYFYLTATQQSTARPLSSPLENGLTGLLRITCIRHSELPEVGCHQVESSRSQVMSSSPHHSWSGTCTCTHSCDCHTYWCSLD